MRYRTFVKKKPNFRAIDNHRVLSTGDRRTNYLSKYIHYTRYGGGFAALWRRPD